MSGEAMEKETVPPGPPQSNESPTDDEQEPDGYSHGSNRSTGPSSQVESQSLSHRNIYPPRSIFRTANLSEQDIYYESDNQASYSTDSTFHSSVLLSSNHGGSFEERSYSAESSQPPNNARFESLLTSFDDEPDDEDDPLRVELYNSLGQVASYETSHIIQWSRMVDPDIGANGSSDGLDEHMTPIDEETSTSLRHAAGHHPENAEEEKVVHYNINSTNVSESANSSEIKSVRANVAKFGDQDGSYLTKSEMKELDKLLELVAQEREYDPDRLYELSLVYRWMGGESLDEDERQDLEYFREFRQRDWRYKEELKQFVEQVEAGQIVDEPRFYCLQLYGRRNLGDDLTDEEYDRLEKFDRAESSIEADDISTPLFKGESSAEVQTQNLVSQSSASSSESNLGPLTEERFPNDGNEEIQVEYSDDNYGEEEIEPIESSPPSVSSDSDPSDHIPASEDFANERDSNDGEPRSNNDPWPSISSETMSNTIEEEYKAPDYQNVDGFLSRIVSSAIEPRDLEEDSTNSDGFRGSVPSPSEAEQLPKATSEMVGDKMNTDHVFGESHMTSVGGDTLSSNQVMDSAHQADFVISGEKNKYGDDWGQDCANNDVSHDVVSGNSDEVTVGSLNKSDDQGFIGSPTTSIGGRDGVLRMFVDFAPPSPDQSGTDMNERNVNDEESVPDKEVEIETELVDGEINDGVVAKAEEADQEGELHIGEENVGTDDSHEVVSGVRKVPVRKQICSDPVAIIRNDDMPHPMNVEFALQNAFDFDATNTHSEEKDEIEYGEVSIEDKCQFDGKSVEGGEEFDEEEYDEELVEDRAGGKVDVDGENATSDGSLDVTSKVMNELSREGASTDPVSTYSANDDQVIEVNIDEESIRSDGSNEIDSQVTNELLREPAESDPVSMESSAGKIREDDIPPSMNVESALQNDSDIIGVEDADDAGEYGQFDEVTIEKDDPERADGSNGSPEIVSEVTNERTRIPMGSDQIFMESCVGSIGEDDMSTPRHVESASPVDSGMEQENEAYGEAFHDHNAEVECEISCSSDGSHEIVSEVSNEQTRIPVCPGQVFMESSEGSIGEDDMTTPRHVESASPVDSGMEQANEAYGEALHDHNAEVQVECEISCSSDGSHEIVSEVSNEQTRIPVVPDQVFMESSEGSIGEDDMSTPRHAESALQEDSCIKEENEAYSEAFPNDGNEEVQADYADDNYGEEDIEPIGSPPPSMSSDFDPNDHTPISEDFALKHLEIQQLPHIANHVDEGRKNQDEMAASSAPEVLPTMLVDQDVEGQGHDQRYRKEFEELIERDERGEAINEDRLYFLQLYARRVVGEELMNEEQLDLDEFMTKEKEHEGTDNGDRNKKQLVATATRDGVDSIGKPEKNQAESIGNQFASIPNPSDGAESNSLATILLPENDDEEQEEHSSTVDEGPRPALPSYDDSILKKDEIDQLNDLLQLASRNQPYDPDRLYELGLLYRWMCGEPLDENETRDVEMIRELRQRDRRFKEELTQLIEEIEGGYAVDEYRFYCLQLYGRRNLGDDLTDAELEFLEEFEKSESAAKFQDKAASSFERNLVYQSVTEEIESKGKSEHYPARVSENLASSNKSNSALVREEACVDKSIEGDASVPLESNSQGVSETIASSESPHKDNLDSIATHYRNDKEKSRVDSNKRDSDKLLGHTLLSEESSIVYRDRDTTVQETKHAVSPNSSIERLSIAKLAVSSERSIPYDLGAIVETTYARSPIRGSKDLDADASKGVDLRPNPKKTHVGNRWGESMLQDSLDPSIEDALMHSSRIRYGEFRTKEISLVNASSRSSIIDASMTASSLSSQPSRRSDDEDQAHLLDSGRWASKQSLRPNSNQDESMSLSDVFGFNRRDSDLDGAPPQPLPGSKEKDVDINNKSSTSVMLISLQRSKLPRSNPTLGEESTKQETLFVRPDLGTEEICLVNASSRSSIINESMTASSLSSQPSRRSDDEDHAHLLDSGRRASKQSLGPNSNQDESMSLSDVFGFNRRDSDLDGAPPQPLPRSKEKDVDYNNKSSTSAMLLSLQRSKLPRSNPTLGEESTKQETLFVRPDTPKSPSLRESPRQMHSTTGRPKMTSSAQQRSRSTHRQSKKSSLRKTSGTTLSRHSSSSQVSSTPYEKSSESTGRRQSGREVSRQLPRSSTGSRSSLFRGESSSNDSRKQSKRRSSSHRSSSEQRAMLSPPRRASRTSMRQQPSTSKKRRKPDLVSLYGSSGHRVSPRNYCKHDESSAHRKKNSSQRRNRGSSSGAGRAHRRRSRAERQEVEPPRFGGTFFLESANPSAHIDDMSLTSSAGEATSFGSRERISSVPIEASDTSKKSLTSSGQPSAENAFLKEKKSSTEVRHKDEKSSNISTLNTTQLDDYSGTNSKRTPTEGRPQGQSGTVHANDHPSSTILPNNRSIAFLQKSAVNISLKQEKVYCSIRNEGFLMAVDLTYQHLLKYRPRLEFLLSLAEWRHVHVLMLYARVFNCELAAANIDQPKEFNIDLPDNLEVLEPLGVVLASIGVVEDPANGVVYIPIAKPLRNKIYEPHDPDDVTIFMEWSQYKWNASWAQVELEREERKKIALARGIEIPTKTFAPKYNKLHVWEHLALKIWLGWDEELWFNYNMATHALSRTFSFVDFPRNPSGSYSWLIPRCRDGNGVYGRFPNPSLSSDVWMIALLFNFGDLPSDRTGSWYYKTKVVEDIVQLLHQFLDSARI